MMCSRANLYTMCIVYAIFWAPCKVYRFYPAVHTADGVREESDADIMVSYHVFAKMKIAHFLFGV